MASSQMKGAYNGVMSYHSVGDLGSPSSRNYTAYRLTEYSMRSPEISLNTRYSQLLKLQDGELRVTAILP